MNIRLLLLLLVCLQLTFAQEIRYQDAIYDSDIHSVQLYRGNFETSFPMLRLGSTLPLTLEFDELLPFEELESDFFIDFIHCDENWKPSGILPIEFYEGFSQDRIGLWQRSENTKVPYVHYTYSFPKENTFFKMSGNYLLKVYRNNSEENVVLTRRFIVVEQQVSIGLTNLLNERVERMQFNRLDFSIQPSSRLEIINPATDLKVKVIQNFRWEASTDYMTPTFLRPNRFDYQLDLVESFSSGSEFRFHDLRSMRLYGQSVEEIAETPDLYYVTLFKDQPRLRNQFRGRIDLNGSYFIEVQEWPYGDYMADYTLNTFRLAANNPFPGKEVYVMGRFALWQPTSFNKMHYDEGTRRYEADILLKQGVYDYTYALYDPKTGELDETVFEGQPFDGENYYTVLVYFRGPLDRAYRLIGYLPINYYDQ
ncbi:MAG: type IX secretion system plug protein domain-containing protein [Bacteroidota bacterium]